jgi:hypothetical protein
MFAIRGGVRMTAASSNAETIIPWTEQVDIGNDFASNEFTCPVDGKYYVSLYGLVTNSGTNRWSSVAIDHNTTQKTNFYQDSSNNWNMIGGSIILNCSADDTIKAYFSGYDTNSKLHENYNGGLTIQLIA